MKALVNALMMMVCLIALTPAAGFSAQGETPAQSVAAATSMVAVNSATVEQLQTLPGIGEVTARRIVEYREGHGAFARAEDLLQVKGVGAQTLEKIRSRISLD